MHTIVNFFSQRHMRNEHAWHDEQESKNWSNVDCVLCGAKFASAFSRRRHQRKHRKRGDGGDPPPKKNKKMDIILVL